MTTTRYVQSNEDPNKALRLADAMESQGNIEVAEMLRRQFWDIESLVAERADLRNEVEELARARGDIYYA